VSRISVLNNDGTIKTDLIEWGNYLHKRDHSKFIIPRSGDKLEQIHDILGAIEKGYVPLLYDMSMKSTDLKGRRLAERSIDSSIHPSVLFFTSGTSGYPIGVVKSESQLMNECRVHCEWLMHYNFEQCVVSVPFFHIYGYLFGLAIPLSMGLDVVTKEDFLPHEILKLSKAKRTLCITNPVFIRAMVRLNGEINLKDSLFICSSGPLESSEAKKFEEKYSTRLVQLYGSSETGGIAIRHGGEELWRPLDGVSISENDGKLCVSSPFLSTHLFDEKFEPIDDPFETTDIVEIQENRFKIIGRASELVKIGGKRLSMIEIESFLESMEGVDEALGFVEYHPDLLRGETLTLYLVGDGSKIEKTVLKKRLHDQFGGIHIESKIIMVDGLPKTALGKKIRQKMTT
jgi:acyl-coenzyme A synthetase/AMP-(fatty) acid ligase